MKQMIKAVQKQTTLSQDSLSVAKKALPKKEGKTHTRTVLKTKGNSSHQFKKKHMKINGNAVKVGET